MVSYQRVKKLLIRRGIPREDADSCKNVAELNELWNKHNQKTPVLENE